MKLFLQILSGFLTIALAAVIFFISFEIEALSSLAKYSLLAIVVNIIPICIIAIGSLSLQNKIRIIVPRMVIAYAGLVIVVYLFSTMFDLDSINSELASGVLKIYYFLANLQVLVLLGSIFLLSRPTNLISDIIYKIAIGVFVLIVCLVLYDESVSGIFNIIGGSIGSISGEFIFKLAFIAIVTYIVSVPLYFMTNYAFDSADVPELDSALNIKDLKEKAEETNQEKMDSIYSQEPVIVNPNTPSDPDEYKEKGLMNLNNSLNQDSNVGQVSNDNKPKDTLRFDPDVPVVQAPVENTQVNKEDSN